MATNYDEVLPRGVAADFVGLIQASSAALALGNVLRMSEAQESLPIVSFLPQAGFVSPRYGGRKPATNVEWDVQAIIAEEIAAVVPVPNAWMMDAGFDVEGQVEASLATAVARVIDGAILFGTGAPATFPTGGVVGAAGAPVTGTDPIDTLSQAFGAVEADGLTPNGVAASSIIGGALRAAYTAAAALPSETPQQNLWGVQVSRGAFWDSTKGDAIVGDWQYLAIGIREDLTFGRSTDGVLLDTAGEIIASAFQDNVTLVKVYIRLGCAIGRPLNPDGSGQVTPFSVADWTA